MRLVAFALSLVVATFIVLLGGQLMYAASGNFCVPGPSVVCEDMASNRMEVDWQYRVVSIGELIEAGLNSMGSEGWELSTSDDGWFIFKRSVLRGKSDTNEVIVPSGAFDTDGPDVDKARAAANAFFAAAAGEQGEQALQLLVEQVVLESGGVAQAIPREHVVELILADWPLGSGLEGEVLVESGPSNVTLSVPFTLPESHPSGVNESGNGTLEISLVEVEGNWLIERLTTNFSSSHKRH